jgi:hypothetical protein
MKENVEIKVNRSIYHYIYSLKCITFSKLVRQFQALARSPPPATLCTLAVSRLGDGNPRGGYRRSTLQSFDKVLLFSYLCFPLSRFSKVCSVGHFESSTTWSATSSFWVQTLTLTLTLTLSSCLGLPFLSLSGSHLLLVIVDAAHRVDTDFELTFNSYLNQIHCK